MSLIDTFGSRLKARRKELNISQKFMAENLEVALSTLSQYETNKRRPNFTVLSQICSLLDVSGDWLLGIGPTSKQNALETQIQSVKDIQNSVGRDSYEDILISMTSNIINTDQNKDNQATELLHDLYKTISSINIDYDTNKNDDSLDVLLNSHIATKEKVDHLLNQIFKHHIHMSTTK